MIIGMAPWDWTAFSPASCHNLVDLEYTARKTSINATPLPPPHSSHPPPCSPWGSGLGSEPRPWCNNRNHPSSCCRVILGSLYSAKMAPSLASTTSSRMAYARKSCACGKLTFFVRAFSRSLRFPACRCFQILCLRGRILSCRGDDA